MTYREQDFRVNSFRDIADRYANTKPIRGTKIIPIGSRTRKFEHIIKVSDTRYDMVLDHSLTTNYYASGKYEVITWEMKKDIEVVTIYNNGFTSVYTFLDNLLPHDLRFYIYGGTGRQYISMNWKPKQDQGYMINWVGKDEGDKDYYLPKDISKPIQFARKNSKWQHIGTEYVFRHAMTQVNKDAKAEIKPYADKFYEWITTVYAMLPCNDWQYTRKMQGELDTYMRENIEFNNVPYSQQQKLEIEFYKSIMRADSHPMRLNLAVLWLRTSDLYHYHDGAKTIKDQAEASRVRGHWNRWINKTLGLTKNIHEAGAEEVK